MPYPECVGVNNKASKELAETIDKYVSAKIIRPDDALEIHIRDRHGLPEMEKTREESEQENIAKGLNPDGTPKPPAPFGGDEDDEENPEKGKEKEKGGAKPPP